MAEDVVVLHHLAIKGRASADEVEASSGLRTDVVAATLASLIDSGLVVLKEGRVPSYRLTPEGRAAWHEALESDPIRLRRRELEPWYREFESVNADLKSLCTSWQLVDGPDGPTPNDHSDEDYDAEVLAGLATIHARASALLESAGEERLDRYERRLADAMGAIRAGDLRRFTAPLCHSYHDVWMELHEDLIRSLDLQRTDADG